MRQLAEPVTHRSERYGWAGWVHWENSGAHFYAWDSPVPFFSVDIYTCKEFDVEPGMWVHKVFLRSSADRSDGFLAWRTGNFEG